MGNKEVTAKPDAGAKSPTIILIIKIEKKKKKKKIQLWITLRFISFSKSMNKKHNLHVFLTRFLSLNMNYCNIHATLISYKSLSSDNEMEK